MYRLMLAGLLTTIAGYSAVTYQLVNSRLFGTNPGRITVEGGPFTASTGADLAAGFSTGGATPTVFTGLATNQASPFRLGAYNQVNAGEAVNLTLNTDLVTPTSMVSQVQSRIIAGVIVTGGVGSGYLLPTFRVRGTFADAHATAFGQVSMCAGNSSCLLSGVAVSSGGVQGIDLLFTPQASASTMFTFGTPFSQFFFVNASIGSPVNGTLDPGSVTVDLTDGVELMGMQVVDANGDLIAGAVIDSELMELLSTPEPAAWGMMAAAVAAMALRRFCSIQSARGGWGRKRS